MNEQALKIEDLERISVYWLKAVGFITLTFTFYIYIYIWTSNLLNNVP